MNKYKITLSGCGDQGRKEVVVDLPDDTATVLSEWDLDKLDCCGGPIIDVELEEENPR